MMKVSAYTPQRSNNIQMKKANNPNFGNNMKPGAVTAAAASRQLGFLFEDVKDVIPKAVEPKKIEIPPYMGGVPEGVKDAKSYLTGPFYM